MNQDLLFYRDHYDLSIFSRLASGFVISLGLVILVCWTFSLWLPNEIKSYFLLIRPNAAFCFILSGISLWLCVDRKNNMTQNISAACAGMVILISVLTLFEYFFGIDLGIDNPLGSDPHPLLPGISLGRMSPGNSTNFALIGCSLFLLNSKILRSNMQQIFVAIVLTLVFLQLLGYLYQLNNRGVVFGIPTHYSQMPIISILAFIILSFGILCVNSTTGIMAILTSKNNGGMIARRLIPPSIFLPIVVGYLVGLGGKWFGLSNAELGISILVTTTIILFATIVILNAYVIDEADIDRKEVEQKLKLNQIKLKAILDNTSAIIYIQDITGRYLLVNKQFEKLFHLSYIEIIGKTPNEISTEESSAKKSLEKIKEVIRARAPVITEEFYANNGDERNYISNHFPLFNEDNIIYAVGCIATDITDLNQMHEALKENEERLVLALKSAEAGAWSWDIPNDAIIWDEHMHKLFGLKYGSFSGSYNNLIMFIYPDDRGYFQQQINNTIDNGTEFKAEFRITKPNGDIHYLAKRGKLYRDETGAPLRMAGVCWDMTERKQIEIDLQTAKEDAEELAKKAEEASRVKSAFLAAMSHEIRTPLNGVIGMTGLLLDGKLSEEQREYVETIRVSGELLLSVINDILDFSKIGSGQMQLERIDFNIYSLIEESIEIIALQIHKKGVAIGAYIESEVPEWMVGDPARIRQVIGNLLNNAAKFTEKGEISLKIKLQKKDKDDITILFEVIDTGIGISSDTLEIIFQPFTQGDLSTSRKYGGSGLGLAISKRLVELMGGTIGVDSFKERGSRFWFTIPMKESQNHSDSVAYDPIPALFAKPIICVDDNMINRDIIKRQLDQWQLHCDTAMDAAEALSMMRKAQKNNEPYALALIDYHMPGMDGMELVQVMRQLNNIGNVPVIMLMSLGDIFDEREYKHFNIPLVLHKPIRQAKLYEAITKVLLGNNEMLPHKKTIESTSLSLHAPHTYKILLVEDNNINQQVALRILKKIGFVANVAFNGNEAIEAIKKNHYDLVFMDCQMPEMDGYTATYKIRQWERKNRKKPVPIIAMTAFALKGDKEKCLNYGMNDYISKPFNIKTLTQMLETYLLKDLLPEKYMQQNTSVAAQHTELKSSIDFKRLREIFDDDSEKINTFLNQFLISAKQLIKTIKESMHEHNMEELKANLHRLQGSAASGGITQVHLLGKKAEEELLNNELDHMEELIASIEKAIENLEAEIHQP